MDRQPHARPRGLPRETRSRAHAGALRRRSARLRRRGPAPRGASWCSNTRRGASTTTCASRSTARWRAGRCRRAPASIRRRSASPCARRITRSSTPTSKGVIPAGNYGAGAMIVWDTGVYRCVDGVAPGGGPRSGQARSRARGPQAARALRAGAHARARRDATGCCCARAPRPRGPRACCATQPASVLSGLTVEELRAGVTPRREVAAALRKLRAPRRALERAALRPMLAATAEAPFSRAGWLFELKYDGVRTLAVKEAGGEVRLFARTGGDRARRLPRDRARRGAPSRSRASRSTARSSPSTTRGAAPSSACSSASRQRDPAAIARAVSEVPVVY